MQITVITMKTDGMNMVMKIMVVEERLTLIFEPEILGLRENVKLVLL